MNLSRFSLYISISILLSCNSKKTEEFTFYKNDHKRTEIIKVDGRLVKFNHYNLEKCSSFEVFYSNKGEPDSISGIPWIHLFWKNQIENYNIGDTLKLIIEVANPPLLESKFDITDNNGKGFSKRINSYTCNWSTEDDDEPYLLNGDFYEYKTIINENFEFIKFSNTYSYKGKPWITITRKQELTTLKN